MARVSFHDVVDDWSAELNAAMNDSQTTMVLKNSGATGCPDTPFYLNVDSEIMRCSLVQTDTPSAGLDTLTVSRGEAGTSAAAHLVTALVEQNIFAIQMTEVQDRLGWLEMQTFNSLGGGDGVQTTSAGTELEVVAQDTPDMTVKVKAGSCAISGTVTAVLTDTNTGTITAPTGDPRIDKIVIGQDGVIDVVTGAEASSPSAPATPADHLSLATISLTVGMSTITNSDITDTRTYV